MATKSEIEFLLMSLRAYKNEISLGMKNKIDSLKDEHESLVVVGRRLMDKAKSIEVKRERTKFDLQDYESVVKKNQENIERIKNLTQIAREIKSEADEKINKIDGQYYEYENQLQALEDQEKTAKKTIKEHLPEIQPPPKKEKIIQSPPNAFTLARSQAASTAALSFIPDTPSSTCNFIQTLTVSPTWLENFCNENNYTKPDLSKSYSQMLCTRAFSLGGYSLIH